MNSVIKRLDKYFDEKGIMIHFPGPIEEGGDGTATGGGDSINREGHFWFAIWAANMHLKSVTRYYRGRPELSLNINTVIATNWSRAAGCVIRHWKGYNKAFDKQYGTSRDQFMPIAIAGLVYDSIRGHKLFSYYKKRYGMMPNFRPHKGDWNGDFLLPDHRSSLHRANPINKRLNLTMIIGDVFRFFSVLVRIVRSHLDHDNVGDSLNLNQEVLLGILKHETWLTKLTAFIWAKFVYGGPQFQLDWYFRHSHAPPINELYRGIHEHYYPKPMWPQAVSFSQMNTVDIEKASTEPQPMVK